MAFACEMDLSGRSPRRTRRALSEFAVEHLINLSQMKLSTDGVDADMVRCLRKTVLVQNMLRRSSVSAASSPMPPRRHMLVDNDSDDRDDSDSDYDDDQDNSDGDEQDEHRGGGGGSSSSSSRRARPTRIVLSRGFAPGVISLVIRPPTPPVPVGLCAPALEQPSACPPTTTTAAAAGSEGFAMPSLATCPDDASLAEEAEDTDSPSPPPIGPSKAPHAALLMSPPDSDMQVVPTSVAMPAPVALGKGTAGASPSSLLSPPSSGGLAGRRRSLVEMDDGESTAGAARGLGMDCAELSPLKRGRSAPDSSYGRNCASELTSLAMLL